MAASMATDSAELSQIAAEARDIANSVSQPPGTHHLLLATFTVPGPADVLLRERGCDEDKVLQELAAEAGAGEPADSFADALARARQLADDCGNPQASGLHLLVALTRLSRSTAAQLLERAAAPVASLRTTALGYLTGAIPRRREVSVAAPAARASLVSRTVTQPAAPARVSTLPPAPEPSAERAPAIPAPARGPSPSWVLDPSDYPWLATHARNLTALAREGRLDPAL